MLSLVGWTLHYFSFSNRKIYLSFNVDVDNIITYGTLFSPFWLTHVIFIYLLFWLIFKNFA